MKAYYDSKPATIAAVGNGSYRYRYDIKEVEVTASSLSSESETAETRKQWQCEEVVVAGPLTSNGITEAVIRENWDGNYEQKMLNEYNAVTLGVLTGEAADKAKERYTAFLKRRQELKDQVDTDCKTAGII